MLAFCCRQPLFRLNSMSYVTVTKAQVPDYLVGSDFYSSLGSDDDEEFTVPSMHLKMTPDVRTPEEVTHLLHTIHFLGLSKLPITLIAFVLKDPNPEDFEHTCEALRGFEEYFHLHSLYTELQRRKSTKERLDAARWCDRKDVIEYIITHTLPLDEGAVQLAAQYGILHVLKDSAQHLRAQGKDPFSKIDLWHVTAGGDASCLRFLLENGCKHWSNLCGVAACCGRFECLKLLHSFGNELDAHIVDAVACNGHVDCLKYALEQGCPIGTSAAANAANNGQLDCLTLLFDHGAPPTSDLIAVAAKNHEWDAVRLLRARGCPWDAAVAIEAARDGNHRFLLRLAYEDFPFTPPVADAAAAAGQYGCLKVLLEFCHVPVTEFGLRSALSHNHIECLRLLFAHNTPLSHDTLVWAAQDCPDETCVRNLLQAGYQPPVDLIRLAVVLGNHPCLHHLCSLKHRALTAADALHAVHAGDAEALRILHQHHCPWGEATTSAAIAARQWPCAKFLAEHGCPLGANACNMDVLQSLVAHGITLPREVCLASLEQGSMQCLLYAVQHGTPLDASMCMAAAAYDRCANPAVTPLQLLRCLHEQARCPWDARTCAAAVHCYRLDVLVYAHEHGCPWDISTTNAAAEECTLTCLRYALERGCPWDLPTINIAADRGAEDCVAYLLAQGCPRNESTCAAAAKRLNPRCLQLLHEAGCPWDASVSRGAVDSPSCLRYCVEHGCPIDKDVMEEYNRQRRSLVYL